MIRRFRRWLENRRYPQRWEPWLDFELSIRVRPAPYDWQRNGDL